MKQYFLRFTGAATLLFLISAGAFAQQDEKDKVGKNDVIIIKSKSDKDTKVTVEVKNGEVTVNGKPLSEFKDDDITISRRKDLAPVIVAGSRFRGGSVGNGWSSDGMEGFGTMNSVNLFNSNSAFLGVTTEKVNDGAKIKEVSDESAAQKAGLKEGDVITKINETKIETPEILTKTIGKLKPEEKITLTIKRDGKEQKIAATLGKRKGFMSYSTSPQAFGYNYMYSKGHLGIKAQETEEGKGLKVLDVDDESPAEKAGIKEGDIITEFDGTAVNDIDKLRELSKTAMAKTSFKVKITRDGKAQDLDVKIPKNLKTTNL